MEAKLDLDAGPSSDTASGDTEVEPKISTAEAKTESKAESKTESKTNSKKDSKKESKKIQPKSPKNHLRRIEGLNLAPVSLTDDKEAAGNSQEASTSGSEEDKQYMKLHAETMGVAPKEAARW